MGGRGGSSGVFGKRVGEWMNVERLIEEWEGGERCCIALSCRTEMSSLCTATTLMLMICKTSRSWRVSG